MERFLSLYGVFGLSKRDTFSSGESGNAEEPLKFENRYWKAEDYYLETELPKDRADLIIK